MNGNSSCESGIMKWEGIMTVFSYIALIQPAELPGSSVGRAYASSAVCSGFEHRLSNFVSYLKLNLLSFSAPLLVFSSRIT